MENQINAHKINKPIQLLAAWLIGLISVNSSFLFAASHISTPTWIPPTLVIASIVNVPIFLTAIFVLQTKFRPEMQEDSFYTKYLETKTGNTKSVIKNSSVDALKNDVASLEKIIHEKIGAGKFDIEIERLKWSRFSVKMNLNINKSKQITKRLEESGVPIFETFGEGAGKPDVFNIAVGGGFSVEHISKLINEISKVTDGWISFAHEDPVGDYSNSLLIGAYGAYNHGLKISGLKELFDRREVDQKEMYDLLGINKNPY